MRWFEALAQFTSSNTPVVLVTLVAVRGHAPREAGVKMLVSAEQTAGTIGGGNLEATAIQLARTLLAQGPAAPQMHTLRLTDTAPAEYGVQCCGGEVTLLLEAVQPQRPCVAIFGVGHVGLALAQILSLCPLELWLVDSRAEMLTPERLGLPSPNAQVQTHLAPIPELVVQALPAHSHAVVMTHDHAEDLAILEALLHRADLEFMGLIGSATKWQNFQHKLKGQGFSAAQIGRITCPIGLPNIQSKAPEAIAIATAAQLLPLLMPADPTQATKA